MKDRKLPAFDRGLIAFLERYLHHIILLLLFAGSVLIRIKMAPETALSPDYSYVLEWSSSYRELGFFQGMGRVIGDYYVPFNIMYAIIGLAPFEPWVLSAAFSSVFDYLLAASVYLLLSGLLRERGETNVTLKATYGAVITLYLPVVFMNSALWKQCDVFYAAFAFLAVWAMLEERFTLSFILLGVSFAFKLQAVYFFPFFCMMYLVKKKFSILQFAWIPGVYLIAGLPAVLCRRGLRATYGTYFLQMMEGTASGTDSSPENYGMVSFYPNLYNFGLDDFLETMALPAVLVTFMLLLLSVVLVLRMRVKPDRETLLYVLAWQIWTCVMFLPSMHERYDYAAVLLFFVIAALRPGKYLLPAALLNVGAFINYMRVMVLLDLPIEWECILYIVCWILVSYQLWQSLRSHGEITAKSP